MATRATNTAGPSGLPFNLLAQAIPMLSRPDLEALTERLIDHSDAIDGDPDLEDDDPAGQCDEDGVNTGDGLLWQHRRLLGGPGGVIGDDDRDEGGDEGRAPARYGIDQTQPPIGAWGKQ